MKKRVVNKIGSPYDIMTANGPAVMPALGEIEADFTDAQIAEMEAFGFYEIHDVAPDKGKDKGKKASGS